MHRYVLAFCVLCMVLWVQEPAEARSDFPTGVEWRASSVPVKRAYLLGIANLASAARHVDPAVRKTAIGRLYNATRNTTVDQAIVKVDKWYADHPDQRNQEVIDVLWLIYVGR